MGQVSIKPRFVKHYKDKTGRERWYLRRRGLWRDCLAAARLRGVWGSVSGGAALFGAFPIGWRQEVAATRSGYVYFLRCQDRIKIGFSKDPFNRINGLRTGLPDAISGFLAVSGIVADEKRLHRQLGRDRVAGERFRPSPELIRVMAQAAAYGRLPSGEASEDE